MTVVRCPAMPEGPQLAHPARSAYDRFPALSGRSWDQPRRGAWGRFEPFAIQLGNDCYLRIPALPGTQRERLLRVDCTYSGCRHGMTGICAFETWSDVSCRRKGDIADRSGHGRRQPSIMRFAVHAFRQPLCWGWNGRAGGVLLRRAHWEPCLAHAIQNHRKLMRSPTTPTYLGLNIQNRWERRDS
jgi:hypothetical protein